MYCWHVEVWPGSYPATKAVHAARASVGLEFFTYTISLSSSLKSMDHSGRKVRFCDKTRS